MARPHTHENFDRSAIHDPPSSSGFGWVFAAVFAIYGLLPVFRSEAPRSWSLAVAGVLAVVAVLRPSLLDGPAALWNRMALAMARVTNPLAMTLLFALVFVPFGALFRLLGKDSMGRTRKRAQSFWIARDEPGPPPSRMAKQF